MRALLHRSLACLLAASLTATAARGQEAAPGATSATRLKVLFLGDNGHHQPSARAADLLPSLAAAGIDLAYTDDLADLNAANLARYDCLLIYANHTEISPAQEAALLDYVEGGRGLVALHCASYCFLNSPRYIALVGGQFRSHETGVFRPRIVEPDHAALRGATEFEAWDETYVHHQLADDRQVLMVRDDGQRQEPWTWVRTQGRGRVFYTASGHDERVFRDAGYQRLVAQGIRWSAGRPEFEFALPAPERLPAELPNYVRGERWGAIGEPIHDMQAPLPPEESLRHISVPGGFLVELFAAEPDIVKPIAIAWDERGSAWVAETVDYPNDRQPEGQGHDRITICEDTDGDGRADRFTRFADKLSIPTGLVLAGGGLIVAQAPHMLLLRDTDGDDVADERRTLFTGFSTEDTHAGPSNLRLGIDNWVYATVGYAGFRGTVEELPHEFRQGLFRFKPDGSELEFLTSTSNNTWGLGLGETGEVFYSTANGEHSSLLAIPNRYFERVRGWLGRGNARMADHEEMHPIATARQVDFHGGFTAAAGHALYTARQFPESYWNRVALICEPTGHLVHMCQLARQGTHYVARDRFNLFASTDEWTAPVAAEVGPDGAVWVSDWYNYIVQHNPTPPGYETGRGNAYETPLRDKTHARIYRVVNDAAPLSATLDLADASPEELVAALRSDNMHWRLAAQRKLVERGELDVVPALVALLEVRTLDSTGENLAAVHAVWTLAGLKALGESDGGETLATALRHASPAVRRAALANLPPVDESTETILVLDLLVGDHPLVRRATLLALCDVPASVAAGEAVADMLALRENAADLWIPQAATCAAARHSDGFLTAAVSGGERNEATRAAVRIVAEHAARGGGRELASLSELLARLPQAEPATAEALVAGLAAGWPQDEPPQLDPAAEDALVALLERLTSAGQVQLASLAARWGLGDRFTEALSGLSERLLAQVADDSLPDDARIAAAQSAARMAADGESLGALLEHVNAQASPELASGILAAAGESTAPELANALIEQWGRFTPAVRRQALAILLRRPEWTAALLAALDAGGIDPADLTADQGQQLAAHPNADLAAQAKAILDRGGLLPSPDRQKVLDELLPLIERTGSVDRGRELFRKTCAKCHRHGDIGETIGPNLTGFAVHPKAKLLTEMIDPNRSVEGNFRQYTVVTTDGLVLNGLLAGETRTAIELVDQEAKRHTVAREDIDELVSSTKSIMPEGFEKQLTPDDFVDLLEFLSARGKFLPLPLDKAATIVSTRGMFYSEDADVERLIFDDWGPKTFQGVPFQLVDPRDGRTPNVILLHGPQGAFPPRMPGSVTVPCNAAAKAIHLLSGVSGWGYPLGEPGSLTMTVRLHYADGATEDHALRNGEHFADYIRRVDVPRSQLAFMLRGQQIRYLAVHPQRPEVIQEIEFIKGDDATAPVVMAVTVEGE